MINDFFYALIYLSLCVAFKTFSKSNNSFYKKGVDLNDDLFEVDRWGGISLRLKQYVWIFFQPLEFLRVIGLLCRRCYKFQAHALIETFEILP